MRIPRIYQPIAIAVGETIELDAAAMRHLGQVLRLPVGSQIIVFNGQGGAYLCLIVAFEKKHCLASVIAFQPKEVESPIALHLAQGIARGEKMDLIIQKAVELGVTKITPLLTQYCTIALKSDRIERKLEHWNAVIISACEQSGRNKLPILAAPQQLSEFAKTTTETTRLVLHPNGAASPYQFESSESIVAVVGPEGGLSDAEISLLQNHAFTAITVGPRILRTETAAIAALTLLQHRFGDMVIA